jgi:glycosyltransferase involved in cell wall biosynthesis
MIRAIRTVLRGEGFASAARRARERVGEALDAAATRVASAFAPRVDFPLLNVAPGGLSPRNGGVAVQLVARLGAERSLRRVAVAHPRGLRLFEPYTHARRAADLANALRITRAAAVHIEGTAGVHLGDMLRLVDGGIRVVVSVHDFSLWCMQPHFDASTTAEHAAHRELARKLLERATALVFPSAFLLAKHRELFALKLPDAVVIEPAGPARQQEANQDATNIAFAGSVKPHKGGHLLPKIAEALEDRGLALHVFGGGDEPLLRPLRKHRNVVVHGYYTAAALPSLLARNRVGLVLLPSITPESFSLTMSEAWLGSAAVAAFDLGAPAERIRRDGGGWLAPLDSGAAGIIEIVDRWRAGAAVTLPRSLPTPAGAARAHVELYRAHGLVP